MSSRCSGAGRIPRSSPPTRRAWQIGLDFVDVQARIHRIDWRVHGLRLPGHDWTDPAASAIGWIDHWRDYYAGSTLVELPVMRYAIAWLRANVACSGSLALCHGDYRIGNVLLAGGNGIFDWELAHVSDPVEDVAYAGLPLFRRRNPLRSCSIPSTDRTRAQQLVNDLTGTIGNINQTYNLNSMKLGFVPYDTRHRLLNQREWGAFFTDTWKLRPNLTLNVRHPLGPAAPGIHEKRHLHVSEAGLGLGLRRLRADRRLRDRAGAR